jgi:hypothetical protein
MSDYDNSNQGAIWKNDKKMTENHPDFRGDLNVDGVEYWVSAWLRSPDASPKSPALKFKINRKDAQAAPVAPPANKPAPSYAELLDDDIPF